MDKALQRAQSLVGTSEGRPDDDFYPTPRIATDALLKVERFGKYIWEPACGDGAISKVLTEYGHDVYSTDLYYHGYGFPTYDFLKATKNAYSEYIITNPPFKLAQQFAEHALEIGCTRLALLCKLAFLEGQERSKFLENSPLKAVYVFRKRLQLTRNGLPYKNGGMIAFAWFVWDTNAWKSKPTISWI